ncbi:hypothetical protein [Luteimonas salinilitoris]|uniref:HTH araC/xylS-type domain-containing protein n=1 Tax=Luteimonas salinilitoris TaxID=3237697 RepID=A0ABV4HKN5_9GAMM
MMAETGNAAGIARMARSYEMPRAFRRHAISSTGMPSGSRRERR